MGPGVIKFGPSYSAPIAGGGPRMSSSGTRNATIEKSISPAIAERSRVSSYLDQACAAHCISEKASKIYIPPTSPAMSPFTGSLQVVQKGRANDIVSVNRDALRMCFQVRRDRMVQRASGGAHTSRTMLLEDLASVLSVCPNSASMADYRAAIIDKNVAGKYSLSSRQRTFRYLREMYRLDLDEAPFRAMLRLWVREPRGRPQIALLMAAANDRALAATSSGVLSIGAGEAATSESLAAAVEREFPGIYSPAIRSKIGRNALSSWTQAGYLARSSARSPALRRPVDPTPGAVAMALVLGCAEGVSGQRLFDTSHTALLDSSSGTLHDRTHDAARKGWLEYRSRGMVTEVNLGALMADPADSRIPLTAGAAS